MFYSPVFRIYFHMLQWTLIERKLIEGCKKVVLSSYIYKTVQVVHVYSEIRSLGYILTCSYAKGC